MAMKRYLINIDLPQDHLLMMAYLVKYGYNFEYHASSTSLIVEVPEEREDAFSGILDQFNFTTHEYESR